MSKIRLRRGFRVESEQYAEEFRSELGLKQHEPLHPNLLCDLLCIPVYKLSSCSEVADDDRRFFQGPGNSLFSATSLPFGTRRAILHNDYQHVHRQHSNIMHEVAHILLGHPPRPPLMGDSCRNYDPVLEYEANQLGFTLLVPKRAALYALESFVSLAEAGEYYMVSQKLLAHRIQITDVRRWAMNRARYRS